METKTNFDYVGYYESVTVIVKNYKYTHSEIIAFEIENDFESGKMLKFADVLKAAKSRGYKGGTILLVLETFLSGEVYRFGNYGDDKWYPAGTMRGFA